MYNKKIYLDAEEALIIATKKKENIVKKKRKVKRTYNNDPWSKFMLKVIKGMKVFLSPAFKN